MTSERPSTPAHAPAAVPAHIAHRLPIAAWFILLVALLHPPAGTGLPICPSRLLTDVPCPGCGLTRSVSCAIRGDIHQSWYYHPFGVFFLAAVFLVALVGLLPERRRDRVWTWATRHRGPIMWTIGVYWGLLLLFGVARMIGAVGHHV